MTTYNPNEESKYNEESKNNSKKSSGSTMNPVTTVVNAANEAVNAVAPSFFANMTLAEKITFVLSIVGAMGCYITTFVMTSMFIGGKDDWNSMNKQLKNIWPITLVGTFGLFIASVIYYIQDPKSIIYFILVIACLAFGMAYSAIALSAITKK